MMMVQFVKVQSGKSSIYLFVVAKVRFYFFHLNSMGLSLGTPRSPFAPLGPGIPGRP
jgi:hypothetical protein